MKAALAVLVAGAVVACGPVYRSEYHYVPPMTADGLSCVSRCQDAEQRCTVRAAAPGTVVARETPPSKPRKELAGEARDRYEKCLKRAQAEYDHCQLSRRGRFECYKPVCVVLPGEGLPPSAASTTFTMLPDQVACERIYQGCFVHCGGRIEIREVCESNC